MRQGIIPKIAVPDKGPSTLASCPAKALEVPGDGAAYLVNKFSCRAYRQAGPTCSVCMMEQRKGQLEGHGLRVRIH